MGKTTDFEAQRKKYNRIKTIKRLLAVILITVVGVVIYAFRLDIAAQGFGVLLSDSVAMLIDHTGYPIALESQPSQITSVGKRAVLLTENSMSVYNSAGNRVINERIAGGNTIAVSGGRYLLNYESGGHNIEIRSGETVVFSHEFEYPIYCADIARNGAFAVATGAAGAQAQVIAYDSNYCEQFLWVSSERVIYSLALDDDAACIAVGGVQMTEGVLDSVTAVFELATGKEKCSVTFADELVLGLRLCESGELICVTDSAVHAVGVSGAKKGSFDFGSEKIAAFDISDLGECVVALGDYSADHEMKLVRLNSFAKPVCEAALNQNVKSIYIYGDNTLAFVGERVIRFDEAMKRTDSTETPDALCAAVIGNQLYYATMQQLCRTAIK